MASNSFGNLFRITTFGESHGPAMGVVIDGCPAGVEFDEELLVHQLQRRRPGSSQIVSARNEQDVPEILSGVFEGRTLGTPIAILARNHDQRSQDYRRDQFRKGHADDMWLGKYGHYDYRGGGRASGRETVARVMGGAVARMLLQQMSPETKVICFASQVGPVTLSDDERAQAVTRLKAAAINVDDFPARFASDGKSPEVEQLLASAREEGKSYGGTADLIVSQAPAFLGQPVFHKIKSELTSALLSVGATFSVQIGFDNPAGAEGSEFHQQEGESHYGGLRGGITTGADITVRVGFKPTATVLHQARQGRHDPCIIPRAIPVLEAMVYLVLADHVLWQRLDRIHQP